MTPVTKMNENGDQLPPGRPREEVTDDHLLELYQNTRKPREIALLRLQEQGNLATKFASLFQQHTERLLETHWKWSTQDPTLAQELISETGSALAKFLARTLRGTEEEQDRLIALQDTAATILSLGRSSMRYSDDELQARLPLCINGILLHQVTQRQTEQRDVGFVLWPSAIVLAAYIQEHKPKGTVLELGAGCGLVGLVAARTGCPTMLTDFNETVLDNIRSNVVLNELDAKVSKLDFYEQDQVGWKDGDGDIHERVDTILGADIICQPSDAIAVAQTLKFAMKNEALILCATEQHRYGVDHLEPACVEQGLDVETTDMSSYASHNAEWIQNILPSSAGYVEGMALTLFRISRSSVAG